MPQRQFCLFIKFNSEYLNFYGSLAAMSALNAQSPTMRYTKTPKSAPSRNEPLPIIEEDAKETVEEE